MTVQDAVQARRELSARSVAGFRVLRTLARDDEAEVMLGHRAGAVGSGGNDADADADADAQVSVASTVALKLSSSTSERWEATMRECAALERARGDHVVELLDVNADDEVICLVFERLPGGDLAELLRLRDRFDAGEAVTLLAPVTTTLLRLHAAGVAHGAVSVRTVLFRDDGTPVLIGFSEAELFESNVPEIVLESVDAVRRDRDAARSLAVTVLSRVAGSRAHAARELLADLEACDSGLVLALLSSRLFEIAAAMPVRFQADEAQPAAGSAETRVVPLGAATVEVAERRTRAGALLGAWVPEPLVQRVLDMAARSPGVPVIAASTRAAVSRWRTWSPARRRVALAAAAAAVTVTIVTAAIPASGVGSHETVSARPTPSTTSHVSATAAPVDSAITADDPARAAVALLRAREHCYVSLSVICLDGVDEVGSAALDDDRAAIRVAQQGGELPNPTRGATDVTTPALVERLGDSALLSLTAGAAAAQTDASAPSPRASVPAPTAESEPASLLLVKSEAGWRIRDVLVAK